MNSIDVAKTVMRLARIKIVRPNIKTGILPILSDIKPAGISPIATPAMKKPTVN